MWITDVNASKRIRVEVDSSAVGAVRIHGLLNWSEMEVLAGGAAVACGRTPVALLSVFRRCQLLC